MIESGTVESTSTIAIKLIESIAIPIALGERVALYGVRALQDDEIEALVPPALAPARGVVDVESGIRVVESLRQPMAAVIVDEIDHVEFLSAFTDWSATGSANIIDQEENEYLALSLSRASGEVQIIASMNQPPAPMLLVSVAAVTSD